MTIETFPLSWRIGVAAVLQALDAATVGERAPPTGETR
jgi:hypothetical protein